MKKVFKNLWRWIWKAALYFIVLSFLWVLAYKWLNPPITYLQVREWSNCPDEETFSKDWKKLEDISPYLLLAVVSSEDQNYMKHYGVDFGAIKKAVKFNEEHKTRKRGASTISQQTAKNVFLWPGRSWLRKGLEVYFTLMIEFIWGKERILEVYLNTIEMGKCTFGAEAAAQKHYNKSAFKLTKSQAATITACLPSPRKSNPASPTSYLIKRRAHVLKQMRLLGSGYFLRYDEEWMLDK